MRHIIVKLLKIKGKVENLKVTGAGEGRGDLTTYKGTTIQITFDFSLEKVKARRQWNISLRCQKE